MALQKTQPIDNLGVNGEYHRIDAFTPLECNPQQTPKNEAHLYLYVSKTTRDNGNEPHGCYKIQLGEDFWNGMVGEETRLERYKREAYEYLKTKAQAEAAKTEEKDEALAWFADATDDI